MKKEHMGEVNDISLKLIYKADILAGLSVFLREMAEDDFEAYSDTWKKILGTAFQLNEMADSISTLTDKLEEIVHLEAEAWCRDSLHFHCFQPCFQRSFPLPVLPQLCVLIYFWLLVLVCRQSYHYHVNVAHGVHI